MTLKCEEHNLSLGREVRFSIISETLKVITCT